MASRGYPAHKSGGRNKRNDEQGHIYDRAKLLADTLFERAKELADAMAPEHPADAEKLDEWDQYLILERASYYFSPVWWDEPNALEDLYRLRQKFLGTDDQWIKDRAKEVRKFTEKLPDPAITPQSEEWDERARQWGIE